MKEVICYQEECVNNSECKCSLDSISIAFEGFYVDDDLVSCNKYQDITETAEYQTPYFMRIKNEKTGREEKKERRGKRLELLGMVFYTEDDTRYDDNWWLTEEKTGYGLGKENLLKHPEVVEKAIKEISPVIDLPDEDISHE